MRSTGPRRCAVSPARGPCPTRAARISRRRRSPRSAWGPARPAHGEWPWCRRDYSYGRICSRRSPLIDRLLVLRRILTDAAADAVPDRLAEALAASFGLTRTELYLV